MTTTTADGVIVSTSNYNTFSYRRKNRRQTDALNSASLLLMGNGIGYGYCLITYPLRILHTYMSIYFVGAIIGALAASFLLHKLRKCIHYYLAGAATLLSGILYLAISPDLAISYYGFRIADGYIAANFLSGLSFGIVLLTSLTHGAEISIKYLRNFNVFQLQISIDVGIFIYMIIQTVTYLNRNQSLNYQQSVGVALIVCSILSFLTTFLFCIESPEFLYETNNNQEAVVNVKRLRKENLDTLELLHDLEEIQNTVSIANKSNVLTEMTSKDNLLAFGKIFILRFAYILGTGLPLNLRFLTIFMIFVANDNIFFSSALYILIRIISETIASLCITKTGNKKLLLVSLFFSGLLLIIINSIFLASFNQFDKSIINCLGILIIFYQLAFGLASGGISLVAMSEGFSYKIKTYYNAIIIVLECIIHIIILNTFNTYEFDMNILSYITDPGTTAYIFVTAFIQIFVCVVTFLLIPETYQTSLKESKELYSK